MPTYFQILSAIISFAIANPAAFKKLWDLIVAGYNASLDLINGIKAELPEASSHLPRVPSDGTLEFTAPASDEELDAEDRLQALIAPGSLAVRDGNNLRRIIGWLQSSGAGAALLKVLFAKMGS
jgi:hypothetical protein